MSDLLKAAINLSEELHNAELNGIERKTVLETAKAQKMLPAPHDEKIVKLESR